MVRRKAEARSYDRITYKEHSMTHGLINKPPRKSHVLREIRYLRKSVMLLIPRTSFSRLVKEIIINLFPNSFVNRIQSIALEALQEATEAYMVQFFEDCVLLSLHAKRVTLRIHDMILTRRLRGRGDIINK
ncbi:PREDICTED: histone H3.3-like type 1 [Eufriesea mexicana]|uniref:histone H3.3-like type 1 n=1 Tax=Eufriesea mexicana TaxID=516756 RepID=UPI00083C3A1D|nr:PREDICTED: histone H3.3-like type 1 [Eufriesea mexicana]